MTEFTEFLRSNSLKATPQRIAVHSAMLELGHASADMVAGFISKTALADVTIASVYNTLTSLAEMGVYSYRTSSNNKMYFDVNTGDHIHFYDSVNHCFKDVADDELLEALRARLRRKRFRGFKVDSVEIQIVGHPTGKRRSLD